jgi:hypothetical protein
MRKEKNRGKDKPNSKKDKPNLHQPHPKRPNSRNKYLPCKRSFRVQPVSLAANMAQVRSLIMQMQKRSKQSRVLKKLSKEETSLNSIFAKNMELY